MTPRVLDASVAIKWFVDEEAGHAAAQVVLEHVCSDPSQFVVPELFFSEMLAVLCKLLGGGPRVVEYLEILEDLGLERVGNGRQLLARAATLAKSHDLTGYDATYAATAELVGGSWLTADARAHAKLRGTGLSSLLGAR